MFVNEVPVDDDWEVVTTFDKNELVVEVGLNEFELLLLGRKELLPLLT